jgi:hypothetical protein
VGNMLTYIIILSAIVVITYLFQFLAYSNSRQADLGTDILEMIGLPLENEFEYEQAVETI